MSHSSPRNWIKRNFKSIQLISKKFRIKRQGHTNWSRLCIKHTWVLARHLLSWVQTYLNLNSSGKALVRVMSALMQRSIEVHVTILTLWENWTIGRVSYSLADFEMHCWHFFFYSTNFMGKICSFVSMYSVFQGVYMRVINYSYWQRGSVLLIKPSHLFLTLSWRAFEDHSLLLWVCIPKSREVWNSVIMRWQWLHFHLVDIMNMTVSNLESRIDTDFVVLYILDQCILV